MLRLEYAPTNSDTAATLARLELDYADTNHRIANSLQFLAATMQKQARDIGDDTARSMLMEAQQRIAAIGSLHRLMLDTGSSELVMLDDLLEGLIKALSRAWLEPSLRNNVKLSCIPVALPKMQAVPLAMITSELVCNALKYAYPSDAIGEIRVKVTIERSGSLALIVEDDGCGTDHRSGTSGPGNGGSIIRSLAARIPATIEQDMSHVGTRITVRADIR